MTQKALIVTALVVTALVATACSDDGVDPITKITDSRVLAITTEPSVLTIDGSMRVNALTVDPDGPRIGVGSRASSVDRPVDSVRMRACAPWKFVTDPSRDCVGADALVLGTDDDGELVMSTAALEAAFPAPGRDAPPDAWRAALAAGLRLRVPIIAEVDVDGRTLIARRDVELVDAAVVRTNPRVVEVRFDGVATTTLRAAQSYALTVTVDAASLDERPDPEMPGPREQVESSFYSPAGELGDPRVELADPEAMQPESEPTTYTTGPSAATWLFVVVTDETGGMGLVSVPLVIE